MNIDVVEALVDAAGTYRASALTHASRLLASIEVLTPGNVGRARFGVAAPDLDNGFGLSDIALVDTPANVDAQAIEAVLLPAPDISRDRAMGIYVEAYGLLPNEGVQVTLSASRSKRGVVSRLTQWLGLSDGAAEVSSHWQEFLSDNSPILQLYYAIDVSGLKPDEYMLRITVRRTDGSSATAYRTISIQ